MADDQSKDDKTEDPSDKRLDEARKEGRVPLSKDAVLAAAMAMGACALVAAAGTIVQALVTTIRHSSMLLDDERLFRQVLGPEVVHAVLLAFTVIGLTAASAVVATVTQTRGGFWLEQVMPKGERLFSIEKLTHIFTKDGMVDLGVAALKATLLLATAATALAPALVQLRSIFNAPVQQILEASWAPLVTCAPRVLLALVALAVLDVVIMRSRYFGRLRMTKDEVRREHKEDEGDPMVRGRRKRKHRDLAQGRIALEVPRADAVVVNPTHIAVAIRYRKKSDRAPRVTAKGKGKQADHIRELAARHGVPIVRDVPLARLMHKKVKVGREVPAEVFRAVAAVLATVYRLTGRPPGTGND